MVKIWLVRILAFTFGSLFAYHLYFGLFLAEFPNNWFATAVVLAATGAGAYMLLSYEEEKKDAINYDKLWGAGWRLAVLGIVFGFYISATIYG